MDHLRLHAGGFGRSLRGWVWLGLWLWASLCAAWAENREAWEEELASIPFPTNRLALNLAEGVPYLLRHWPSNHLVKALLLEPGATDELYFRPGQTWELSPSSCSWLEALRIFTNRPSLQLVYHAPFLLLKRSDDQIQAEITGTAFRARPWLEKAGLARTRCVITDQSWEHLQPFLKRQLKVACLPAPGSPDAAHFYRAFWSGWNLNRQELLAAACLATRTSAVVEKRRIIFKLLPRIRE